MYLLRCRFVLVMNSDKAIPHMRNLGDLVVGTDIELVDDPVHQPSHQRRSGEVVGGQKPSFETRIDVLVDVIALGGSDVIQHERSHHVDVVEQVDLVWRFDALVARIENQIGDDLVNGLFRMAANQASQRKAYLRTLCRGGECDLHGDYFVSFVGGDGRCCTASGLAGL